MKFKLQSIITKEKPGELVNIDIKTICKQNNIEMNPNNIFYITDLNSIKSRGQHSNSNVQEILICLQGSFEIKLNNGNNEYNYLINKNEGIYVARNIWLDFYNFKNCVIIVFAEIDATIKKESIYNYSEFKKFINL